MAIKFFHRNTNVDTGCDLGADTDGDLSETQGSSTQIDSASINDGAYRDVFSFDIDTSSGYNRSTGTFSTSLDVVASVDVQYRVVIRSVTPGCGETDEDVGPDWTGNSIQTDTTASITWPGLGKYLRLVVQALRTTAHGNKTLSINVNDADTFCQANGWTAVVTSSPVIAPRVVRDYGQIDPPIEAAPQFFPVLKPADPPAAANPVIGVIKSQLLGDTLPTWDVLSHYTSFPELDQALFPANPVPPYRLGQWLGDAAPTWDNLSQYISFPEVDKDLFPSYPVIPYTVGQHKGDTAPTWDNLAQYIKFPELDQFLFPANPVPPVLISQMPGDRVPPVEAYPQYIKSFLEGGTPPVPASPVIPLISGQWRGDAEATWEVLSQYYKFPELDQFLFPASPVPPILVGQWRGDVAPTWDNLSQYIPFPELDQFLFPASPVVPYRMGQWLGDVAPTWENLSHYISFPELAQALFPTYPVIPFRATRLLGDIEPPVEVKPRFYVYVNPDLGPVLPGLHLPLFIQAAGAWLDDPPKHSYQWDPSEAPFFIKVPTHPVVWVDYEAPVYWRGIEYAGTTLVTFEVYMKATAGFTARARLVRIDTGTILAEVDTTATTYQRLTAGASLPSGPLVIADTPVKCQAGYWPGQGETMSMQSARLRVLQSHVVMTGLV